MSHSNDFKPGPDTSAGPGSVSEESAAPALAVGSSVQLRKAHACGGLAWTVTRVGADVGLECATCARRILLPRDEFHRRLRRLL